MNEIVLKNARLNDMRSGLMECAVCGCIVGRIGNGIKSFKLVFVCKCSSMGEVMYKSPKKYFRQGSYAIMKNGSLICPDCGRELASINTDMVVSAAFRIRCSCGAIYDKYKDYSELNKRLKEYK